MIEEQKRDQELSRKEQEERYQRRIEEESRKVVLEPWIILSYWMETEWLTNSQFMHLLKIQISVNHSRQARELKSHTMQIYFLMIGKNP